MEKGAGRFPSPKAWGLAGQGGRERQELGCACPGMGAKVAVLWAEGRPGDVMGRAPCGGLEWSVAALHCLDAIAQNFKHGNTDSTVAVTVVVLLNSWLPSCEYRHVPGAVLHALFKILLPGTSLGVQWLRLCTSNGKGAGSIPGRGTKISCASRPIKRI